MCISVIIYDMDTIYRTQYVVQNNTKICKEKLGVYRYVYPSNFECSRSYTFNIQAIQYRTYVGLTLRYESVLFSGDTYRILLLENLVCIEGFSKRYMPSLSRVYCFVSFFLSNTKQGKR